MLKSKKMVSLFLAMVMVLSFGAVGVFADGKTKEVEEGYVNSYVTEDGIKVKIFDPNVTMEFSERDDNAANAARSIIEGTIYIQPGTTGPGNATRTFTSTGSGMLKFGLSLWEGGPYYNVSLVKRGVNGAPDSVVAVAEDVPKAQEATLRGLTSGTFYFRLSTWYTPGTADWYAYVL